MSISTLSSDRENQPASRIDARWWMLATIVVVGICSRLLPHPDNFSPIMGIALFAGASFGSWRSSLAVTMITMIISDLFLGMHWTIPIVYASICLNILIGHLFVRASQPWTIPAGALLGSVQFYIITNAACLTDFSIPGVVQCYAGALPFFRTSLMADLVFSLVLFGSFAFAQQLLPALRSTRVAKTH